MPPLLIEPGDTEKLITINNSNKTYTEMTFKQLQESLNKIGAELGGNVQGMEEALWFIVYILG
jgi:hypothetical protein